MEGHIQLAKPMRLDGVQLKAVFRKYFQKIKNFIRADIERGERIHQAIEKHKEEVIQMSIRHGINLHRFY